MAIELETHTYDHKGYFRVEHDLLSCSGFYFFCSQLGIINIFMGNVISNILIHTIAFVVTRNKLAIQMIGL